MAYSAHRSSVLKSFVLVALAGCGSGAFNGDPAVDAGAPEADANVDTYSDGDWLFEPDRLLSIEIEMDPADWDSLRFQTRNILEILGEDCGSGPAPKVFTYFPATVTIEGETFAEVGVRKKGFLGSLSDTKPSLKIKLHEYVPDQKMSGLKRFTLNNSVQDPSYLNQCIGYDVFRAAGIPAPRCNFAKVTVNGQAMGIYVNVEAVKKPFLRLHFGNDEGNLYEGTLSDFRDGWTNTFEKKTNKTVLGQPDIDELTAALTLDGDAMRAAIDPLVDVDEFMTFWAVEILVAHWDGYTGNSNNFFIYDNPATDKMVFMPWGADQLFGDAPGSISSSATRSVLDRKLFLHAESRDQYVAAMTKVLDTAWDDQQVLAEIDRMEALISAYIPAEEQDVFTTDLTALRATVDGREAEIRSQLGGLSSASANSLMEPLCFTKSGSVTGPFSTTWGAGGTADLLVDLDGSPLVYTAQTSIAVPDDNNPDEAIVAVFGDFADGSRSVLFVPMPITGVSPGTVNIDTGFLLFYPPGGGDQWDRFELVAGSITFSQASTVVGQPVTGTFALDIWQTPFF